MRLDEDYLRELELWPMFALQQRAVIKHAPETMPVTIHEQPDQALKPLPVTSTVATSTTYAPPHNPLPTLPTQPIAARPASITKTTKQIIAKSEAARPAYVSPDDPERAARIAALDWQGLAAEAASCQACGLCKQRKQAVFGVGAKDAPWLFIGEGPGAEEDQQGEPFVGQAGQLLEAMFAAAGLKRGREVYIANVVKCRPPGNRTPAAEEALSCAPLLDRQIELIKPKLLVALGKTAAVRLTASEASMASLRGQLHSYSMARSAGSVIPVVATYHPAYLLRNPPDKLKAWEDLMLAKKTMEAMNAMEAMNEIKSG